MEAMMTITVNDILTRLWCLANLDPKQTSGKTGSQKRAFRLILDIRGGAGFVACRPVTELEELAKRGVCSADLRATLRGMARVELAWRNGRYRGPASFRSSANTGWTR
jgi:hypothetical protein